MNNYNVIGVVGHGNSGASAVMDMLLDCEEINVYRDSECQILHCVDGILDLKHYIVDCKDKVACNAAIQRFKNSLYDYRSRSIDKTIRKQYQVISEKYINSLIKCTWYGWSAYDPDEIRGLEKHFLFRKIYGGVAFLGKKF